MERELHAIRVCNCIYVVGTKRPKPMNVENSNDFGDDGTIADIDRSDLAVRIGFEDGDRFMICNTPFIAYYKPKQETAGDIVSPEA